VDLRRSFNGALAGGIAAAIWAAQQPADKRAFDCEYDDVELLGRAVAAGDDWPLPGLLLHLQNGAAFGAMYAQLSRFVPGPAPLRGAVAASVEHLVTWPLVALVDSRHPRRRRLPKLRGNRRAFWQGWYRHALFGLILGALEARLNAEAEEEPRPIPASSNGHGTIELAVGAA
jgi:hypothetical protein